MKLLFRTKVVKTKGTAHHMVASPNGPERLPDPVQLSVCSTGDGSFFLFRDNAKGIAIADTWHETAEDAKETGESEYEITGWSPD